MNNFTFGGDDGTSRSYYETIAGGSGAGPHWHGQSAVQVLLLLLLPPPPPPRRLPLPSSFLLSVTFLYLSPTPPLPLFFPLSSPEFIILYPPSPFHLPST